jgi:cytochrome P450
LRLETNGLDDNHVVALVVGEDAVECPPRVDHHDLRFVKLGLVAGLRHLDQGGGHLADQQPQLVCRLADVAGGDVPRRRLVAERLGRAFARFGQAEDALAVLLLGANQPLVFKLLHRGIDRARTRPPSAAATLGQLLDDLVPVARFLGEQPEDGGADIAAPNPRSVPEEAAAVERSEWSEWESATVPAEPEMPVPAAPAMTTAASFHRHPLVERFRVKLLPVTKPASVTLTSVCHWEILLPKNNRICITIYRKHIAVKTLEAPALSRQPGRYTAAPSRSLAQREKDAMSRVGQDAGGAGTSAATTEAPRFDPYQPGFLLDPYPFYHRIREVDPVNWSAVPGSGPDGAWYLFRHDDILALLRDQRLGREWQRLLPPGETPPVPPPDSFGAMVENWMLFRDPPTHTRLRSLVTKAFTPRAVQALRSQIEAAADDLLDRALDRGREMDLIADFAFPLPVTVIALILGVRPEDRGQFREWSMALAKAIDLDKGLDPEIGALADRATRGLGDYLRVIVAERRQAPADDLISGLLAAEEGGIRLTEEELIATLVLLLVAGHETTVNLIGNGTIALLRNPDQLARLRDAPDLMTGAVEELLRYDSPVQITFRFVFEEIELRGKTIRPGEWVGFVLGSANRDPAVYPDPDRLDVGRTVGRTAAFGMGIHFCLGAPLARLEGEVAFRALLTRCPDLRLATEAPDWRSGIVLRGLKSLPVAY